MYQKNLQTILNGYTNFPMTEKEGDPTEGDNPKLLFRGSSPADVTADVRDTLSFLAGKGYTSLSDKDARANYQILSKTIGTPLAQKLVNQVFLFNQRPEAKSYSPEKRVQVFYDIGSRDKDVNDYLGRVKAFGSGVNAGLNDSVLYGNQQLVGKESIKPTLASADNNLNEKLRLQL